MTVLFSATVLSLIIWVYLLMARSRFWLAQPRLSAAQRPLVHLPSVVAIIPARNEAAMIADVVTSLRNQRYSGDLNILVVDDQSSDATAQLARQAGGARVRIIQTPPLPPGWSGKTWALETAWQDVLQRGLAPDYIWLNDADIVHQSVVLEALISQANWSGSALTSLMVTLDTSGVVGRLLIPAFVYFFQLLYPFPAINGPALRTAGAAGGCVLLEREALQRIGGFVSLKDALIDDCTLARHVQDAGGTLWLGHGPLSKSVRPNDRLGAVWTMVKRTAYAQLSYNPLLLAGCLAGLGLVFLVPPLAFVVGIAHGDAILLLCGAAAWLLMAITTMPTLKLYQRSLAEAFLMPFVTLLYGMMTLDSARSHVFGAGNRWKDRSYGKAHKRA